MAPPVTTFGIRSTMARNAKVALTQFQQQKQQSAEACQEFFNTSSFDDVGERAYAPQQLAEMPLIPDSADPMVAFVAATMDMQQRQTEQMKAAAQSQALQREETMKSMKESMEMAKEFRQKHLHSFQREMTKCKQEDVKAFSNFANQQKTFLRETLKEHTKAEQARLDAYRKESDAAAKKKLDNQESKFARSVSQVTATLEKHGSGITGLTKGLKEQREETKSLKMTIERKAAAAVGAKNTATTKTITAIQSVGKDLKKEQQKGASQVVSAVSNTNRAHLGSVRSALKDHGSEQKKVLTSTLKQQQEAQIKGLKAAVMHQKEQQAEQLTGLRNALEARRRAMASTSQLPGISSTLSLPSSQSMNVKQPGQLRTTAQDNSRAN